MNTRSINIPLLLLVSIAVLLCGLAGITRLHIDTDIVRTLPRHDAVLTDALAIFANHPIHDQIAVDVGIDADQSDTLIAIGAQLDKAMRASSLFTEVGLGDTSALLVELTTHVVHHLPALFSSAMLEQEVAPLLESSALRNHLHALVDELSSMDSIGKAAFIGADPLGLRNLILARLKPLAPSPNVRFYQGQLLSSDGKHLLLTAKPKTTGTDTAKAGELAAFFKQQTAQLVGFYAKQGISLTITPVGAYKAGLDNEAIIKHDVQLALGLSTAGIALLMLLAFPRPLYGLLTLVPALAGIAMALFIYSLVHDSISIMVLGFAGALISLMDDHSITYLLFLDRPQGASGAQAAREVQSIGGTMALCTTIGSFLVLSCSDFPVFNELGQFTALGFICTFLFIHLIFPRIFPQTPPTSRTSLPLHKLSGLLFNSGAIGAGLALAFMLIMLCFAKPDFHISLEAMNTVSRQTLADDAVFSGVWGGPEHKIYLMTTAADLAGLQTKNDSLLADLEKDQNAGRIGEAFVPSLLFPGKQRCAENINAWNSFWNETRLNRLVDDLHREGQSLGFAPDAFANFLPLVQTRQQVTSHFVELAPRYEKLLQITAKPDGERVQFITIAPGKAYDPVQFLQHHGTGRAFFDPEYFSTRLGQLLFTSFSTMLLIIATMVASLLFLQFLCWRRTLITLTPLVFAYICTLGTLRLIGHPIDIPGLMLSVVILGLGVDFCIYSVCGSQWYGTLNHPSFALIRSAIVLSSASTLIGFGVLCFAEHATLRSIGITSLCGLGYTLIGTFVLLPPLLERFYAHQRALVAKPNAPIFERVRHRYRLLEAYPRLFARFKLKADPLFRELPALLAKHQMIRTVLDIGCGYGVPACWCLEYLPACRVIGIDPDPERVRAAARATGERGTMLTGSAPALEGVHRPVDVILLLDMLHYLDDAQLEATLRRCCSLLADNGLLIMRSVIRPPGKRSWYWFVEDCRVRLSGGRAWYRSTEEMTAFMSQCGFVSPQIHPAANPELFWLTGQTATLAP